MNKDIIRIAEAMGWTSRTNAHPMYDDIPETSRPRVWYSPQGTCRGLPNPLESHDDCHALIEWLNGRGFHTMIHYMVGGSAGVRIEHDWEDMDLLWSGDDYRQGVVELTLKLLDESDE